MSPRTYEVTIDAYYCKGCGLCVEFCPQGKLSLSDKPNKQGVHVAQVAPQVRCTGCGQCIIICPDAAVRVRRIETPVTSPAGGAEQASDPTKT